MNQKVGEIVQTMSLQGDLFGELNAMDKLFPIITLYSILILSNSYRNNEKWFLLIYFLSNVGNGIKVLFSISALHN